MSEPEIVKQIDYLMNVTEVIIEAHGAIKDLPGLPEAFQGVAKSLPLVKETLRQMKSPARKLESADDAGTLGNRLTSCERNPENLLEIFQKISRNSGGRYVSSVYQKVSVELGKHRVETLMDGILESLEGFTAHRVFETALEKQVGPLAKAREELAKVHPSLPASDFDEQPSAATMYGDRNRQYNASGSAIQRIIDGNNFEAKGDQHFGKAPEVYRVIPFPRNENIVDRAHIFSRLESLLPTSCDQYQSAALYGLGGSGKTQVALEYVYRRCRDPACFIFWVHADNETTFAQDYQTIAKGLGLAGSLDGEKLLAAVCGRIGSLPRWLLVLDNADDLALFGVGRASPHKSYGRAEAEELTEGSASLYDYIPRGATGTVLWTSRDERIIGTLVGPQQGVSVSGMSDDEAMALLKTSRNEEASNEESDDAMKLLEELQWLPLAISQAGAYLRRTSTPIREYLSRLAEGKERWRVLEKTEFDRHRRRHVPNSILETLSISIEPIRRDNEVAYKILHIIAYVSNQDIPFGILAAAGTFGDEGGEGESWEDKDRVVEAVTRLKEFSFLRLRGAEGGVQSYEMHKLVQEATRYGLSMRSSEDGVYFSNAALRIMAGLFPERKREKWAESETYVAHVLQVGEWAEMTQREEEVSDLLTRVSDYLFDRGRWREKEPVDTRALELRRRVLGETHPDTIRSMTGLATTYYAQGRYSEAKSIDTKVLELRRRALGETHPDTIRSMAGLAATYYAQGRYSEAESIETKVLKLQRWVLGETHPDTIQSMAGLAATYHAQGRYSEAEPINTKVLELQRRLLGETHPDSLQAMHDLAFTWNSRHRRDDAIALMDECLQLRRSILGVSHPHTRKSDQALHLWKTG